MGDTVKSGEVSLQRPQIRGLHPNPLGHLTQQFQFCALLVDAEFVADDRGSEAALRADGEALQGNVAGGLVNAPVVAAGKGLGE